MKLKNLKFEKKSKKKKSENFARMLPFLNLLNPCKVNKNHVSIQNPRH